MGRIIIAAVVGGIVLFVWGFVSWVVIPWHQTSGWALDNEAAVVAALQAGDNEAGLYWIPGMPEGTDEAEWTQRHRAGPVGMLVYQPGGAEPLEPAVLVTGVVINVVGVGVAAIILSLVSARRGYLSRVFIVVLLGAFLAVIADGTYWNFMRFPADFTLVNVADRLIGWTLVGVVIAAIVRPRPPAEQRTALP